MAERTIIYYYTGSGNTLSVSRRIAEGLGNTDVRSIYTLKDDARIPEDYGRVGIATATWFIRPPRIVKEICSKMQLNPSQKVFIVATCGGYDGFVLIDLKAILQPKVNAPIQTFMLPMPPNHIVGFSPMPDAIVRIYLNHEKKATKKIVRAIQTGKRTKDRKGRGRKAWNWCSRCPSFGQPQMKQSEEANISGRQRAGCPMLSNPIRPPITWKPQENSGKSRKS